MQLPATWQGMPGQPQLPGTAAAAAAAQQMAAAAQGAAAMQQPAGMMAYPMQQFQVNGAADLTAANTHHNIVSYG